MSVDLSTVGEHQTHLLTRSDISDIRLCTVILFDLMASKQNCPDALHITLPYFSKKKKKAPLLCPLLLKISVPFFSSHIPHSTFVSHGFYLATERFHTKHAPLIINNYVTAQLCSVLQSLFLNIFNDKVHNTNHQNSA